MARLFIFSLTVALLLPRPLLAGSLAESPVALFEEVPPPTYLRVSVPGHAPPGPQSCAGEYELLGVRSHGAPVWKQWGGDRYLFQCDQNGLWFIGNDTHLLHSCEGYVFSTQTFYASPDFSELDWYWPGSERQSTDGEFTDGGPQPSNRMSVTATGPPEVLDVRVCG